MQNAIRRIEIKTKRLSQNIFAGQYHSAFRGRGMSFAEVREYQYGDDVRDIDWNVTARFNRPYVKIFEEERELTVMLLIDVSGSLDFGTRGESKRQIMAEIAATLAFSAIFNNDKIGVIFFSNEIEKFIPPKKGKRHILHIIKELTEYEPKHKLTDIGKAVGFLNRVVKRRCTTFLISDFYDLNDYERELALCSKKHDTIAIQLYDVFAKQLPDVGLLMVSDAETGKEILIDTSDSRLRYKYAADWIDKQVTLKNIFKNCRVDNVSIATNEDFVVPLLNLFKQRA